MSGRPDASLAVEWDQRPGTAEGRPLTDKPVRVTVGRVDGLDGLLRPPAARSG